MLLANILPLSISWASLPATSNTGSYGISFVKSVKVGDIQIREVVYSPNYAADHWCDKGHVVMVLSGALTIVHQDGSEMVMVAGSTYVVGDNSMPHKAMTDVGATVMIVD